MLEVFLLRRIRFFNKSRYSRNRQTTRVMFYFSLYINIIVIFFVYSILYGFMFKLLNLWWVALGFLACSLLPITMRHLTRK